MTTDLVRRLMVTDEYELLMHVKMEIVSPTCGIETKLDYNAAYLNNNPYFNTYATSASSGKLNFNKVYLEKFSALETCKVLISGITSDQPYITAGTGSTITITGSNFGSTRGAGSVWFTSADVKNANQDDNFIDGLDPYDYVSWSDDVIVVRVPSIVVNAKKNKFHGAGSGPVKVTNSQDQSAISEPITIRYSQFNSYTDDGTSKEPRFIKNHDTSGGITFRLGLGAYDHPKADEIRASVEKALQEWSCYLDIDLKLGSDIATGGADDHQNVIYGAASLQHNRIMQANTQTIPCGSSVNGGPIQSTAFSTDMDIVFAENLSWEFNHEGTTSGSHYDFHHVLLHELGHALGLGHINDPNEIMYYASARGELNDIRYGTTTLEAAQYVVEKSKELTWKCSGNHQTISDAVVDRNCDFVTGIGDEIKITPNKTIFSPGSSLSIDGLFISKDGDTHPVNWNWSLNLYHGGGTYTYASRSVASASMNDSWTFTSNTSLPANAWVRTSKGGIMGYIKVYTTDNNGEINFGTVDIEVNYKPNRAEISDHAVNNQSVHLIYNSAGAAAYKIYYGNQPGSNTGQGLDQGDSPISTGSSPVFDLTGLSPYQDYYIRVAGYNQFGEGIHSETLFIPKAIPTGADAAHAIDMGTLESGIKKSDIQNNSTANNFGNSYTGPFSQPSDDIFYKFTVATQGDVTLNTCGTSTNTYIHLLDANGNHIQSNGNGSEYCSGGIDPDPHRLFVPSGGSSYIKRNLAKGTYYLVVEGAGSISGSISTSFALKVSNYLYNVSWTDLYRVSISGTTVTNTNTTTGWKSSAASTNTIRARESGWVELIAERNGKPRMIGLSRYNWYNGADWTKHWNTIQYNMYMEANGTISIYESGVLKARNAGTFATGDKLKIERQGGEILYKVNNTTLYTSRCDHWDSFIVDMCLFIPGDSFKNVKTTAVPQSISAASLSQLRTTYPMAQPNWSDSTSVNQLFEGNLKVYPNPGESDVSITFNSDYALDLGMEITNESTGRKVYQRPWAIIPGNNERKLDVRDLRRGYYILTFTLGDKSYAVKFQKL